MGYATGYIPGDDFGRLCDVCGRLRPGKTFRTVENLWICDRHPSYIPRQQLDRVPYVELGAPRSIPYAKPWNPVDTYEVPEAQILNLVTAFAPADALDVTNGAGAPIISQSTQWPAAGWACLYLYDLIAENKRPARWLSLARTVLGILADFLYSGMTGGPGVVGHTNQDVEWGTYDRGGASYVTADSAVCGYALLRAYQALGASKYLSGARACAWFLRTSQCGDKVVSGFFSSDAAGTSPRHFGGFARKITGPSTFDPRLLLADLFSVEFLKAFKDAIGDETIGSSATTAVFGSSRAATVSTVIDEAIAFFTTPQWSVDDGAPIVGLSTATPRDSFTPYPGGRGSWELSDAAYPTGTTVTAIGWAQALRGLRAVNGDSAVTALFDWLMTFSSNPAFALGATSHAYGQVTWTSNDERGKYAGIAGTYDPRLALAQSLQVRTSGSAGTTLLQNAASLYDLASVGHLAPLYSARQASGFGQLKDALEVPRPRWRQGFEPRDGQFLWLGPLATCGLSFQPYTDGSLNRNQSIRRAAQVGRIYRYAPQAYTMQGH
jgi:hypothetical protein